jgi:hypothetical protein
VSRSKPKLDITLPGPGYSITIAPSAIYPERVVRIEVQEGHDTIAMTAELQRSHAVLLHTWLSEWLADPTDHFCGLKIVEDSSLKPGEFRLSPIGKILAE